MNERARRPPPKLGADARAVQEVVEEVVSNFHRLKAVTAELHGEDEQSASRRGVLRGLARGGPQTVPQMARERPVSRQFIQSLVDDLLETGAIELVPNPAHARSHLVQLTEKGWAMVEEMEHVEATLYRRFAADFSASDLAAALKVLRGLRQKLSEPLR
jgi:DNA-binding MarR family transcriptional regulator